MFDAIVFFFNFFFRAFVGFRSGFCNRFYVVFRSLIRFFFIFLYFFFGIFLIFFSGFFLVLLRLQQVYKIFGLVV